MSHHVPLVSFHHSSAVQVRFNDIDMLGHVNNAKLQEYFDLGRMNYLGQVLGVDLLKGELVLVIASTKTDFDIPVYLSDRVEVLTAIVRLGNKSLQMVQHIRDASTGVVKTRCSSAMVCIQKQDAHTVSLPLEWIQRVRQFEKLLPESNVQ